MPISEETLELRRAALISAARALIRERGSAGFSMLDLAKKAGVSAATPYNLLGSKSAILTIIVQQEFSAFRRKMTDLDDQDALSLILLVVDRLAKNYTADQQFYFGLFRAAGSAGENSLGAVMLSEGRSLFLEMVGSAIRQRASEQGLSANLVTDILLRNLRATVEAWYVDGWSIERFRDELAYSARLVLLPAFDGDTAAELRQQLIRLQRRLSSDARNSGTKVSKTAA